MDQSTQTPGLVALPSTRAGNDDAAAAPTLLLVEPLAAERGGHPMQSLPRLAAAASDARRPALVVAADGIDSEIRATLEPFGARILQRPPRRFSRPGLLLLCARALNVGYETLQPRFPRRLLPYQLQLFSRCFLEAASLRIGKTAAGRDTPVTAVVLTANLTLHACTTALAGVPHVRYLHDLSRHESRAIRAVEWMLRGALRRTRVVCTTTAIENALQEQYPGIESSVQTYALHDPAARLHETERDRAREILGLAGEGTVGSLIGGWWRVKDMSTVAQGLSRVTRPFTLLVAGYRMDKRVLAEITAAHGGELHVIDRALTSAELSLVFTASDFTIVSRAPSGKESGVALEAASRGLPIVISDHDDELTRKLDGQPWARVFRCGDPDSLARALDDVCSEPLQRPSQDAAAQLGMVEAGEMLETLDRAAFAAAARA
jgi:glycosyltransferase involved in cell wall biosynthesis